MSDESQSETSFPLPRKRPRRLLLAVTMLVVVGLVSVGGWLYHLVNTPSTGKGVAVVSSNTGGRATPSYKIVAFKGKRFSFNYSNEFSPTPVDASKPPILENYLLVKHQTGAWDMAIQVESLPSGDLNDDSSYHSRKGKPDIYNEKVVTMGTTRVDEMTNTTSTSLNTTAFFTRGGLLGLVTISGGNYSDRVAMQAALDLALTSWKWL